MFDKKLQDEVIDTIAKNMADDINEQVITAITMEYIYPYKCDMDGRNDIADWIAECIGWRGVDWDYRYGTYYFKNKKDLEFFMLRWL